MVQPYVMHVLTCAALLIGAPGAGAHDGHRKPASKFVGPSADYVFPLAEPGTYRLPTVKRAAGGRVLDEHGREHDLAELLSGRISVLAFIYTRCVDICPTASLRLADLQDLAAEHPEVASWLRLVSLSFDPEHDTPEVMAEYAGHWRSSGPGAPEWHYVTAADQAALEPILKAYDQSVMPKPQPSATGSLSHILRVFLVDPSGQIRNIYSLDFLDPELVLNDIRTLIPDLEPDARRRSGMR